MKEAHSDLDSATAKAQAVVKFDDLVARPTAEVDGGLLDTRDAEPTVPDLPLLLSVETVARLLGMGRTATYEAIRRNEIPHRRVGRRIVVPMPMLRRWLGFDD